MAKVIRLTENDLNRLVKKIVKEQDLGQVLKPCMKEKNKYYFPQGTVTIEDNTAGNLDFAQYTVHVNDKPFCFISAKGRSV